MGKKRTVKQSARLKQIGIRICPDLWQNLRKAAFTREISVSKFVGEAILTMIESIPQAVVELSAIPVAQLNGDKKRKRVKPAQAAA